MSTLILLAGIQALAMSVFLPSLHDMTLYFGTTYGVMQFAVSAYMAAIAIVQILIGPIGDRFGRRPVVLVSLAIFSVASIAAIFAPTVEIFMAARLVQSVVVACVVMSRALVRDMFPDEEAASMIGYVTMGMAVVPMVGPMIGGALDQMFGWKASFVLLAAGGIGVWVLAYRDMGETVSGAGVGFREQLRTYPELLTSPRFWGYVFASSAGSGAFFALLGGASFVSGTIFHLSPFMTGLALGAPAVGYAIGNGLSGRYSVRLGIDRMVFWGGIVATAGMGLSLIATLVGYAHPILFFGPCVFLGLGNGMMLPNATAGAMSIRPHLAGTASGLSGAIMMAGGAALAALAGALLTEETGALPLQVIMLLSSLTTVIAILLVMRRTRRLAQ